MKLTTLLILVALAGCGDGGHDHATPAAEQGAATAEKWLCPMHPTYIADRLGACPICGMDLVPATEFLAEQGGGAERIAQNFQVAQPWLNRSVAVADALAERRPVWRNPSSRKAAGQWRALCELLLWKYGVIEIGEPESLTG